MSTDVKCWVVSIVVFGFLVIVAWDAYRQGSSWLSTLLWGVAAGLGLELAIVLTTNKSRVYYFYNTKDFFCLRDTVPYWVGVGWGIVLYASTWTAQRLKLSPLPRALVAGALAVNIDFSLDPVASYLGFWNWRWDYTVGHEPEPLYHYFKVPYDNYVAWFGIVSGYAFFVRWAYRWADERWPRNGAWRWTDFVVPPAGVLIAGGIFAAIREPINDFYHWFGTDVTRGQTILFFALFVLSSFYLWNHILKSRRDLKVNAIVIAVPAVFHGLMLLFVFCDTILTTVTEADSKLNTPYLLVTVPMNLLVGIVAYAWPSLDTILKRRSLQVLDEQRDRIIEVLREADEAALDRDRAAIASTESFGSKRGLVACRIAEACLTPGPQAELIGGELPPPTTSGAAFERVARAVSASLEKLRPIPLAAPAGGDDEVADSRLEAIADRLILDAAAALRGARNAPVLPAIRREEVRSYTGQTETAWIAAPRNEEELKNLLANARDRGLRVSFRGGGHAFDTQSLNSDLVISLELFKGAVVSEDAATITVQAGETWGKVLERSLEKRRVPYVIPTARGISVGGSLSAHVVSRFSSAFGREGQYVDSFRMVLPNGDIYTCSPTQNADLFGAVIGGLGYLGAILSVTYRLLPLERTRDTVAVETKYTPATLRQVAAELSGRVGAFRARWPNPGDAPPFQALALHATVFLHGKTNRGLVGESRYIDRPAKLDACPFHTPDSFMHRVFQVAAHFRPLRILGFWYVLQILIGKGRTFTDDIVGYTFFEDGNAAVRRWGRKVGLPLGLLQQTFWLPGNDGVLETFLAEADTALDGASLVPALIDVLFAPEDRPHAFVLSSSARQGFLVSFSFEKVFTDRFEDETAFLERMARVCLAAGGRIHLVKNVRAAGEDASAPYADAMNTLKGIRLRYGATALLANEFSDRVLPEM